MYEDDRFSLDHYDLKDTSDFFDDLAAEEFAAEPWFNKEPLS